MSSLREAKKICDGEGHVYDEQGQGNSVICSRCRKISCEVCDLIWDERTELGTCKNCHMMYNSLPSLQEARKKFMPVLKLAMSQGRKKQHERI